MAAPTFPKHNSFGTVAELFQMFIRDREALAKSPGTEYDFE
jgi:hypothetical protein